MGVVYFNESDKYTQNVVSKYNMFILFKTTVYFYYVISIFEMAYLRHTLQCLIYSGCSVFYQNLLQNKNKNKNKQRFSNQIHTVSPSCLQSSFLSISSLHMQHHRNYFSFFYVIWIIPTHFFNPVAKDSNMIMYKMPSHTILCSNAHRQELIGIQRSTARQHLRIIFISPARAIFFRRTNKSNTNNNYINKSAEN